MNTDKKQPIDIIIEQPSKDDTGEFFAQWDTTMNELVYYIFILMVYTNKYIFTCTEIMILVQLL